MLRGCVQFAMQYYAENRAVSNTPLEKVVETKIESSRLKAFILNGNVKIFENHFHLFNFGGATVQSKSLRNTSPPIQACHSQAISTLAVLESIIKNVAATNFKPYFLINSLVDR